MRSIRTATVVTAAAGLVAVSVAGCTGTSSGGTAVVIPTGTPTSVTSSTATTAASGTGKTATTPGGVTSTQPGSGGSATAADVGKNANVPCQQLGAIAAGVSSAQTHLYGSPSPSAVATVTQQLTTLEASAPASLHPAINELIQGFQLAEQVLTNPTTQNKAQLDAMSARLSADAQQISSYVVAACPSH